MVGCVWKGCVHAHLGSHNGHHLGAGAGELGGRQGRWVVVNGGKGREGRWTGGGGRDASLGVHWRRGYCERAEGGKRVSVQGQGGEAGVYIMTA